MNADPLGPAAAFPYLVQIFAFNNSYWASLYQNLRKAQRCWGVVAKLLTKTGATVQLREMLYRVVVQTV